MAKAPKNGGSAWTAADDRQLRQLARENTPTRVIAIKLARTPGAVSTRASQQGVSLKPSNQSPYGTKKRTK
jgi:hypothetical protein